MWELVFVIISVLIAITVHEASHAFAADRLGDPTAKHYGRLTLNPFAHLDPIGTLSLIIFRFGWGKPVPVNYHNLKHPGRDNFLIALSGPISNFILATLAAIPLHFSANIPVASSFLTILITINIFLGVFNLLPIPPLDGSKIWHLFLSDESYIALERMGPFILIAVLLFSYSFGNVLFQFIELVTNKITSLIM